MQTIGSGLFGCYDGRRVFVTGHTGFKGSWICEWLLSLGAEVHGFALEPPTEPALFGQLGLTKRIASHMIGDIRDRGALTKSVHEAGLLNLDITKAREVLGWTPRWDFKTTVAKAVEWYVAAAAGEEVVELTARQVREYCG